VSKNKAKSPCIGVCKIGKTTGLCKGCLRSREEIKGWKKLSKSERRDVLETVAQRKSDRLAA
jgi:predicted Fe-S protein YdhL (DUF1289 family)